MTYQISVPHIHCSGCCNLLKLTLEDFFQEIEVDQEQKIVTFKSKDAGKQLGEKLALVFQEIAPLGYQFENLQTI